MGPFKWLQKRGATGGIARWAWRMCEQARTHNPDLSEKEIAQLLWVARYTSTSPRGPEALRFEAVEVGRIENLLELCGWITFVEMDTSGLLSELQMDVMEGELERLGWQYPEPQASGSTGHERRLPP